MKKKQKPTSFSMCEENIAYIEQQHPTRHRNRSHWMDDLITHLRLKESAPATQVTVVKKPKAPVKRFVPPGKLEVQAYMLEKGVHISKNSSDEAEKFCDFYESNGWKVGKNKMKCWKAAVRNWLKGNDNGSTKNASKKLSAYERQVKRNDELYRQPNERELGVGAASGNLGRAVAEGAGGATLEHVDTGAFVDYE